MRKISFNIIYPWSQYQHHCKHRVKPLHKGWILLCQKPWSPINLCVKMHCQNITHMSDHGCIPPNHWCMSITHQLLYHLNLWHSSLKWHFWWTLWPGYHMFKYCVPERVKQYLGSVSTYLHWKLIWGYNFSWGKENIYRKRIGPLRPP